MRTNGNDDERDEVDERSMQWMSDGIVISHRIMVVALAMILPVLAGWGCDQTILSGLGPRPIWGILVGVILGMIAAGWQLRGLLRWLENKKTRVN